MNKGKKQQGNLRNDNVGGLFMKVGFLGKPLWLTEGL